MTRPPASALAWCALMALLAALPGPAKGAGPPHPGYARWLGHTWRGTLWAGGARVEVAHGVSRLPGGNYLYAYRMKNFGRGGVVASWGLPAARSGRGTAPLLVSLPPGARKEFLVVSGSSPTWHRRAVLRFWVAAPAGLIDDWRQEGVIAPADVLVPCSGGQPGYLPSDCVPKRPAP